MKTLVLTTALVFAVFSSATSACSVSGTAFTQKGKPIQGAVVRLIDLDSQQTTFATTDANAAYQLDSAMSGQRWRVDLISSPTVVTGTHLPTRSIIGQSDAFACTSGQTHQDVRVQLADAL